MAQYQIVARIEQGAQSFNATRVYYPLHPANAVEFDEESTGCRTMLFGPCKVTHLAVDNSPKAPLFTNVIYYGFWLGWLLVAIVGGIIIARILHG